MIEIQYSSRPNAFSPEQVLRLEGDSLILIEQGKAKQLALADVVRVRLLVSPGLRSYGNEVMPVSGICKLRTRDGGKRTLTSLHYRGIGQIEDRSDSYAPFIEALLPRIAAANPAAVFLSGMSMGLWILWIFVLLGNLAVLAMMIWTGWDAAMRREWIIPAFCVLGILGFGRVAPRLFRIVVHGRSRPFRPAQI